MHQLQLSITGIIITVIVKMTPPSRYTQLALVSLIPHPWLIEWIIEANTAMYEELELGSTLALPHWHRHGTSATLEQWNFPCFSSNDIAVAISLDYFGEEIDYYFLLGFLISINDENNAQAERVVPNFSVDRARPLWKRNEPEQLKSREAHGRDICVTGLTAASGISIQKNLTIRRFVHWQRHIHSLP